MLVWSPSIHIHLVFICCFLSFISSPKYICRGCCFVSSPLGRIIQLLSICHIEKIPCIGIFNNSFYYNAKRTLHTTRTHPASPTACPLLHCFGFGFFTPLAEELKRARGKKNKCRSRNSICVQSHLQNKCKDRIETISTLHTHLHTRMHTCT